MPSNPIVEKSFSFAVSIVKFCKVLEDKKHFVIASQLLKSGTAIGANIRESQHPETMKDFIHKLKIAAKEAHETAYWLELCKVLDSKFDCEQLCTDCNELSRILSSIISTSKQKLGAPHH